MDDRLWRVRVTSFFNKESDARDLVNHAEAQLPFAIDINPGKPNQELKFAQVENHWEAVFDLAFPLASLARLRGGNHGSYNSGYP